MKEIKLSNSHLLAIIDDEDCPYINRFNWYLSGDGKLVIHTFGKASVSMQQLLIKGKDGSRIMHKNNNFLDNRKINLVVVPEKVLTHHTKKRQNVSSIYKGVCWDKNNNKWRATIKSDSKVIHLGRFDNEFEAALAYNEKAVEIYGEYAYQNKL